MSEWPGPWTDDDTASTAIARFGGASSGKLPHLMRLCHIVLDVHREHSRSNAALVAALRYLYDVYVVDMHGPRTCDCDRSVPTAECAPCVARAALAAAEGK